MLSRVRIAREGTLFGHRRHYEVHMLPTISTSIAYDPSATAAGTYSQDWVFVNVSVAANLAVNTVTEAFDGSNSSRSRTAMRATSGRTTPRSVTAIVQGFVDDNAGNTDSTGERSITRDTTAPSTSDNWTISGWQNREQAYIELTASDMTSSVDRISYRVDGGSWTTVAGSTAAVTISADGNHTLGYNATDTVDNQEQSNTEYVTVNSTPPAVDSIYHHGVYETEKRR